MPTYRKPTKKECGPPLWQNFPSDGIWLVQTTPNHESSACIMKIDELPSVYPFAQMAVSADDLCKFLGDFEKQAQEKTGVYTEIKPEMKTLVSWAAPSTHDTALAILKWLSQQIDKQPVDKQLLKG